MVRGCSPQNGHGFNSSAIVASRPQTRVLGLGPLGADRSRIPLGAQGFEAVGSLFRSRAIAAT
jgi:hypothetical protein